MITAIINYKKETIFIAEENITLRFKYNLDNTINFTFPDGKIITFIQNVKPIEEFNNIYSLSTQDSYQHLTFIAIVLIFIYVLLYKKQ